MNIKKLTAAFLGVALCAACLTGCSESRDRDRDSKKGSSYSDDDDFWDDLDDEDEDEDYDDEDEEYDEDDEEEVTTTSKRTTTNKTTTKKTTTKKTTTKRTTTTTTTTTKSNSFIEYECNEDGNIVKAPMQVVSPDDEGKINISDGVSVKPPNKEGDEYIGNTQSRFIYWLDITEDHDFKFEGQFVKLIFKVKDDAVCRDYPITITSDIATIEGSSLNNKTKRLDGVVRVGGSIEAQDVSSEKGLTVYADKASADPGDTIDYYLNIKNNPGAVAVIMWISFDANALELIGYESVGEFADVAGYVVCDFKNNN